MTHLHTARCGPGHVLRCEQSVSSTAKISPCDAQVHGAVNESPPVTTRDNVCLTSYPARRLTQEYDAQVHGAVEAHHKTLHNA